MQGWLYLVVLLPALSAATAADATVVGGGVETGTRSGRFTKLDPAEAFSVGKDNFESADLYAFDEDQNIILSRQIVVDVGIGPGPGDEVASHYVFFDPAGGGRQTGYVDFDAPIYGVATRQKTMADSDDLANTQVTYLSPGARGLEAGDKVSIDPENPFRLHVIWGASSPGDYIRVFTRHSPIAAKELDPAAPPPRLALP
ncbi:MAG: hypothetical protein JNK88_09160 [Mangrovicoccus sp.]|nr:hypothetical protein [Mangrovicoccus sp.]